MAQRQSRFGRSTGKNNATDSPNYTRWSHMRHRCYVESDNNYFNYGKKGIIVYKEWITDFFAYEKYIMSLPNAGKETYTIDRIDSSKNYEPENLRWASKVTQSRNCRISSNNKSGVTGVSWDKRNNKWRAVIAINYKTVSLGRFDLLEDAISARKQKENEIKFYKQA